jgi:hypothetical protein
MDSRIQEKALKGWIPESKRSSQGMDCAKNLEAQILDSRGFCVFN